MSERAKRDETLDRIRQEHPHIDEDSQLVSLAMEADKASEKKSGIKWIIGSVVFFALGLIVTKGFSFWLLLAVSGILANGLRLIINDARIAQRYRSVPEPEEGGLLTRERIEQECAKGLKVTGGRFYLVKAPLYDMGVDYDTGLLQLFTRQFFFRSHEGVYSLSVKSRQYRTAALGAEYYVVLPRSDKFREQIPVRAYQSGSWTLSEELLESFGEFPSIPEKGEQGGAKEEKQSKLLPGLSIALSFASMFVPATVSIFFCLGALALAVLAMRWGRNIWTAAAMMFAIMSTVVMVLFFVPAIMG